MTADRHYLFESANIKHLSAVSLLQKVFTNYFEVKNRKRDDVDTTIRIRSSKPA